MDSRLISVWPCSGISLQLERLWVFSKMNTWLQLTYRYKNLQHPKYNMLEIRLERLKRKSSFFSLSFSFQSSFLNVKIFQRSHSHFLHRKWHSYSCKKEIFFSFIAFHMSGKNFSLRHFQDSIYISNNSATKCQN